jgi:stage II sporulation protein D
VIGLLGALAGLAVAFDPMAEAARLQANPPTAGAAQTVRVEVFEGTAPVELQMKGQWLCAGRNLTGSVRAQRSGANVKITSTAGTVESTAVLLSGGDRFCIGSKSFRGSARIVPNGGGLAVVNELELEDYLLGVVPGEIGRKLEPRFMDAVKAQAVVARTYTLRSLGQYGGKAWDVRNDTRDQVYDGASGEDVLCSRAVRSTVGQILADSQGRPIDAYYHSTSGGHTADICEVWPQKPVQPYLRGVPDTAPDGRAWGCAAPVASWTETWSVAELHRAVQRDLSEALGKTVDPGEVLSLRLEGRDTSGRARKLVVEAKNGTYEVVGDRIRWALHRSGKGRPILRSTRFELKLENGRYVAEGTGNGHGLGLSQNGAMGRSWAGQSFAQILSSYYPGTFLRTLP